ncbi:MAG: Asp-tRNA(Asn)/Glu-tRNA(Gln) amidotransferase subunit GatA [Gammaproteobacteria bacterium]|jgi:aspartyl-tRNA(Asn)/glutamyl-tRNA(Gln) amidotransferase subunit A|nr:Asp-tRNA(Asn)/Glu-tRNA(Gln) amidotransferase GatCAB subunit A [Gammaproteobacteria bacterium]MBQ08631.1 Asp-tRNA(Asn)/Glu-tRNA(Gln) amidotransferase GatCAB subunit A [Gammaproteobacteria bacterium]MDP6147041.1 Asp-tRNA(Asn)/Glu-tRNA(Gln) amidotransferase subunit GatA [Gammaproteobacteria bacterium]|tara:strand:+ start:29621 stop:31063 length:1443 start_codon:yes stop_codon:yes gene_type:complete
MKRHTVRELQDMIADQSVSSDEVYQLYLNRIKAMNDSINAFISIESDETSSGTEENDSEIKGVPYALKDIFCSEGDKTTCGSKMLSNFVSPYDATVVKNLRKKGTIILGKTNMDEFAMGSSNETSFYGNVLNPWDTERTPGGSSGGSAAAVAAGMAPIALGTDTGGSIRQPAALTGITGLKPTYGRCSRYGMIAFASSLDQAGILSISAEDAAIFLEHMAGYDHKDSTSSMEEVPKYTEFLNDNLSGKVVGLPKEFFDGSLDSKYQGLVSDSIHEYEKMGIKFKDISLPNIKYSVPTYYVVAPAECSSNLARYDGVRFGHRSSDDSDLDAFYKKTRKEGFGQEVKRRIITGTYVLSAGYYDAYYLKAQKVRQLINQDFLNAFKEVDVIMGPTTQQSAFKLGEKVDDPVSMYMNDIYTISSNLSGVPAISHPIGFVDDLPFGMQVIAPHFMEHDLLNIVHKYQMVTDWHLQIPGICRELDR